MNYYQPRQVDPESDRPDAGKWRYTKMNDGKVWAVGYCAEGCEGHDTPEGAYEHQTQFVLDHEIRLDVRINDQQLRCVAPTNRRFVPADKLLAGGVITGADAREAEVVKCGEWTGTVAEAGMLRQWPLCDEHRNREVVAKLLGTVGDEISSW